jgi:glycosyltransferase involved in cell wall biosynthesis
MKATPEISVVIPTRARPQMLRRALESALRQDIAALEVIVVIDGEDLETKTMIEQMLDPRIHVVALSESVGGSEARNVGARVASGRYIALLDDDDEWLTGKLKAQLAIADAFPGKEFVVVTQYLYRAEGREDEVWPARLPVKGQALSEFLFGACGGFQTSTYLCPRELFLRMPFTPGLKKHQDWDWFLRLAALPSFEMLVVEQPLSVYWVPQRKRVSVSGGMDWEFSRNWATQNVGLMTRRAYASFLVKVCARDPTLQRAGFAAKISLLHNLVSIGRPTPAMFVECLLCIAVGEGFRLRFRPAVQWWRTACLPRAWWWMVRLSPGRKMRA